MRTAALWDELVGWEGDPLGDATMAAFGGGSPAGGTPFLVDVLGDPNALIIVEAAFGADIKGNPDLWNWYDITADVRQADGNRVTISPMGRSDECSQAQPAGCKFQLDNTTGDYMTNHPGSKWWPYVRRNTPIRVRVYLYGGMSLRYQGYANGWPASWDISCNLAVVTVSASGILRRLNQGKTPLKSPLYRAIAASGAIAFWSLEDGSNATQAGSAIGGSALTASGTTPKFAAVTGPGGTDKLPDFANSGALIGNVPTGTSSKLTAGFPVKVPTLAPATKSELVAYTASGGTLARWVMEASGDANGLVLSGTYSDGSSFSINTNQSINDGNWHWVSFNATQSGADILVNVYIDGALGGGPGGWPVTLSSKTMGNITAVQVNPSQPNAEYPLIGPAAIWPSVTVPDMTTAMNGFAGETTTARIARLCAEEGVPVEILGTSDTTMGPQSVATFVTLLRECEATEDGLLGDGRGPGSYFITRQFRYNRPASLSPDMAADQVGDPFEPVDDDQRNRNIIKVDQKNGSSATYEDTDGPLGTDEIQDYDSSVPVNYRDENGLLNRGAFEVRKGTVPGFRYPTLRLDIAATPALARSWLATPLAGRIDVLNVSSKATQHPPGTVSLLLEGYSETLSPSDWEVGGNCSPFEPWRVAVIESSVAEYTWRWDSGGSTLHQDYPAGTTSILVDISDGYPWSGTASDWPRDLDIGGVQVTATGAPTGVTQQTFTIAATAYPLAGGSAVKLWRPPKLAL